MESNVLAFPNTIKVTSEDYAELRGMTLRDYFAAKELSKVHGGALVTSEDYDKIADHCFRMGDAMMRRRGK